MVEGFRSLHDAHSVMSFLAGQEELEFVSSPKVELFPYSTVKQAFTVLSHLAGAQIPGLPFSWADRDLPNTRAEIAHIPTAIHVREIMLDRTMPIATEARFTPLTVSPRDIS